MNRSYISVSATLRHCILPVTLEVSLQVETIDSLYNLDKKYLSKYKQSTHHYIMAMFRNENSSKCTFNPQLTLSPFRSFNLKRPFPSDAVITNGPSHR